MVGEAIGNYRIRGKLGEGGMGIVYAAVHERIGSKVAIKILPAEHATDPAVVQRFFNEARAANLVHHPGIAGSIDYGTLPDGSPYIVMEYLEGETLRGRLRREGAMGAGALRICRQIAAALSAAHERGLVHRDLKPENVMLVPDPEAPGGERAKVLDFGIAKIACDPGGEMTRTGVIMGTPFYMSPEQCKGAKEVGPKGDVYSLGIMLFEMLTDALPFRARGVGEMLGMHLYEQPPKVTSLNPGVARPIEALISAMLEKDHALRPTMAEVVASLEAHAAAGTEAVHGPPAGAEEEAASAFGPTLSPSNPGVSGNHFAAPAPRRRLWVPVAAAVPLLFSVLLFLGLRGRQGVPAPEPLPAAAPEARALVSVAPPRVPDGGQEAREPAVAPSPEPRKLREAPAPVVPARGGSRRSRGRNRAVAPQEEPAAPRPAPDALAPVH